MTAGALNPLQVLKADEMNIPDKHDHTAFADVVCRCHLRELRNLVTLVHQNNFRICWNDVVHHLDDRVEACNDVCLADQPGT